MALVQLVVQCAGMYANNVILANTIFYLLLISVGVFTCIRLRYALPDLRLKFFQSGSKNGSKRILTLTSFVELDKLNKTSLEANLMTDNVRHLNVYIALAIT